MNKKSFLIISLLSITIFISIMLLLKTNQANSLTSMEKNSKMKLTSNAFLNNEMIPSKYTCDGENISPLLHIADVPENTKSLVLIVDDPDAPVRTFTHWVLYNIPANTTEIRENIKNIAQLPDNSQQGKNDFGQIGYGGPCPSSGVHRYFFKLYAVDKELNLKPAETKANVEKEIKNHIIAKTELIGLYKRR